MNQKPIPRFKNNKLVINTYKSKKIKIIFDKDNGLIREYKVNKKIKIIKRDNYDKI